MPESLNAAEYMFLGPIYRTRTPEVRARVDRLLGIEPGHRDSNQIIVRYCEAKPEVRAEIDKIMGIETDDDGSRTVG